MAAFPLFDAFPRLRERMPRISLGDWPTPVQRLTRFGEQVGMPNLWIKREDLSLPDCGGNKTRGLEFLLAAALAHGAQSVLTFGAVGSFHVRATAVCAARVGLRTLAVLAHQPRAAYVRRNLAIAAAAGARLVPARLPFLPSAFMRQYVAARVRGERPYLVPPGGTSPAACVGQVNAALELKQQIDAGLLPEPDVLFVPLGSLGTAAGLALGLRLAGLRTRMVGVVVFSRWYCTAARWARLARRTGRLLCRLDPGFPVLPIERRELTVTCEGLGRGYACFTEAGIEVAWRMADREGLLLDGTYTAKTYAAALAFVRREGLERRNILIWHTFCPGAACAGIGDAPRGLRSYVDGPMQVLDERLPGPGQGDHISKRGMSGPARRDAGPAGLK